MTCMDQAMSIISKMHSNLKRNYVIVFIRRDSYSVFVRFGTYATIGRLLHGSFRMSESD